MMSEVLSTGSFAVGISCRRGNTVKKYKDRPKTLCYLLILANKTSFLSLLQLVRRLILENDISFAIIFHPFSPCEYVHMCCRSGGCEVGAGQASAARHQATRPDYSIESEYSSWLPLRKRKKTAAAAVRAVA